MPPPKKRDKDTSTASTIPISGSAAVNSVTTADGAKLNGHQQEQELFLQAFEKPTQIYRYLRNRHSTNPTYLNRTLSYMKDRMSRSNKSRISFKLNGMLSKAFEKTSKGDYLNIIFTGLFDSVVAGEQSWNVGDSVTVDIILYKLTKSKRKDCNTDFQELKVLRSTVIFKPNGDQSHYSAISVPMKGIVTCHNSSLKLAFRISSSLKYLNRKKSKKEEAAENGDLVSKRRSNYKMYGAELRISEKPQDHTQSGVYESLMVELYSAQSLKSVSPRKRTWESVLDSSMLERGDPFEDQLTLKFILQWSTNEIPETVTFNDLDKYGMLLSNIIAKNVPNALPLLPGNDVNFNNNCIGSYTGLERQREKLQVVYNFLYSNNMRQQTEYTEDVVCPWCGVDCMRLYALLKHLKLCHGRFNFMYHPSVSGARIDVTLNDAYDGSYAGSPYDLAGPSGSSFARTCGPVRRTSVTNLLVCRPRRQKTGLDEFLVLDEDDLSNQRPYITGHNRLYHHTETCLPVHPKELDIDSEGESDPLWLRQKTIQMIDEFSDVNEGEKELMKLWNLHVMKYGYVGDCQLPLACEMFLDSNGHEIIRKNLYRNFILHMCSLFDYGLVAPETVYKTMQKLQGMLSKYPPGQVLMSQQRAAQLNYWLDIGIHKQDEQRLKSPQKTGPVPLAATPLSASSNVPDNETVMHPPSKRLAVKRASMHLQHNLTAGEKLNASVTSPSKAVAKKSATQPDEQNRSSGKRTENGAKRMCLPSAVVGGITAHGRDAGQERDTNSSSNSSHNNNNNGKAATDKQRNAEAKAAPQVTKRKYTHRADDGDVAADDNAVDGDHDHHIKISLCSNLNDDDDDGNDQDNDYDARAVADRDINMDADVDVDADADVSSDNDNVNTCRLVHAGIVINLIQPDGSVVVQGAAAANGHVDLVLDVEDNDDDDDDDDDEDDDDDDDEGNNTDVNGHGVDERENFQNVLTSTTTATATSATKAGIASNTTLATTTIETATAALTKAPTAARTTATKLIAIEALGTTDIEKTQASTASATPTPIATTTGNASDIVLADSDDPITTSVSTSSFKNNNCISTDHADAADSTNPVVESPPTAEVVVAVVVGAIAQ